MTPHLKKYFLLIPFFLSLFSLHAQHYGSSRKCVIHGYVVDSLTGKPLARAEVYLSKVHFMTLTDDSGYFYFDSQEYAQFGKNNLKAGSYIISVSYWEGPDHDKFLPMSHTNVKLKPGDTANVKIKLGRYTKGKHSILHGYVYDSKTNKPIYDAEVEIAKTEDIAQTDTNGFFSFDTEYYYIKPGDYLVKVSKDCRYEDSACYHDSLLTNFSINKGDTSSLKIVLKRKEESERNTFDENHIPIYWGYNLVHRGNGDAIFNLEVQQGWRTMGGVSVGRVVDDEQFFRSSSYVEIGSNFYLSPQHPIIGPKISIGFSFLFSGCANLIYYTDFHRGTLFLNPNFGISLGRLADIYLGYNIPLTPNYMKNDVNHFTFTCSIPFIGRSYEIIHGTAVHRVRTYYDLIGGVGGFRHTQFELGLCVNFERKNQFMFVMGMELRDFHPEAFYGPKISVSYFFRHSFINPSVSYIYFTDWKTTYPCIRPEIVFGKHPERYQLCYGYNFFLGNTLDNSYFNDHVITLKITTAFFGRLLEDIVYRK
jgi:hypothetical protein